MKKTISTTGTSASVADVTDREVATSMPTASPVALQRTSFQYEYAILDKLGFGMYGEIFKVRRVYDGKVFVLKKVPLDGLTNQQISLSMSEHQVMRKLNHPSIVKFYESCVNERAIQIIMEHAPRGDLAGMIELQTKNKTLFEEKVLWEYMIQICEGLHYLHQNRILHRDIKAQNIFLDANLNIKIGDLGLVREFGPSSVNAFSQVGTPLYFSPELCKEEPYNDKSDVWSFGCLMYEMACLRKPFEAKNTIALMRKICDTEPPELPHKYSNELKFVIKKMLEKDADHRPTIGQILGYGPVHKLLPESRWRRKMEALNKYRDDIQEEFQQGKLAIDRLHTMEREIKAEREDSRKKFASFNRAIEYLKEEKVRMNDDLEGKVVELNSCKSKLATARKEKKSLLNRIKNLEDHNKLLESKVKKNRALYAETKKMLEDERCRSRQRSRPPTPQRRNPTPGRKSTCGAGGVGLTYQGLSEERENTPLGEHSTSVYVDVRDIATITPSPSPNPSPIPFPQHCVEEPLLFTTQHAEVSPCQKGDKGAITSPSPRPFTLRSMQSTTICIQSRGGLTDAGFQNKIGEHCEYTHSPALHKPSVIAKTSQCVTTPCGRRNTANSLGVIDTTPLVAISNEKRASEAVTPKTETSPGDDHQREATTEDVTPVLGEISDKLRRLEPLLAVGGLDVETSSGYCGPFVLVNSEELDRHARLSNSFMATPVTDRPLFGYTKHNCLDDDEEEEISCETDCASELERFSMDEGSDNMDKTGIDCPYENAKFDTVRQVDNEIHSPDRGLATPSPQIDLPPSIARVRFESLSEQESDLKSMPSSAVALEVDKESGCIGSVISTRNSPHAKKFETIQKESIVSPPPRFLTRTRYHCGNTGAKACNDAMESPTCQTDSPLQPRSFTNFFDEKEVLRLESPSSEITPRIIDPEEQIMSQSTPPSSAKPLPKLAISSTAREDGQHQNATEVDSKTFSWASQSVGRQFRYSSTKTVVTSMSGQPVPSPCKSSPGRVANGLVFNSQFFGLLSSTYENEEHEEHEEHTFTGLYHWQRIHHGKTTSGRSKGSVARGRVWRNHCPFQLQSTAKSLCILYKARGPKMPTLKTFKVRRERAGEHCFAPVKFCNPIQISCNSDYERWFFFDVNQETNSNNISEVLLHFEEKHLNAVEEVVVLDFDRKFIDLAANSGETNSIAMNNKIFAGKSEEKDINTTPMAHALSLPFEEESAEQETVYQPAKRRESRRLQQLDLRGKHGNISRCKVSSDTPPLPKVNVAKDNMGALTPSELLQLAEMVRHYDSGEH
jgi:serine/threonine protein kinase